MGLDIYFYNRKKTITPNPINTEDVLNEILTLSKNNNDLLSIFKQLKEYSILADESLENCLYDAIKNYLDKNMSFVSSRDEVAYFRNFWYIIHFFNYSDEYYGKDKVVTKKQLEDAVTLAKKTLMMVEKHFRENGWIIEQSPLNYDINLIRDGGDKENYLTFENGIFTEELEQQADAICESVFDSDDSFLFMKVCELYFQFSRILKDTDFDNEQIVINADW